MTYIKHCLLTIVLLLCVLLSAEDALDKKLQFDQSLDSLGDALQEIVQQSGIPVLYEGYPQMGKQLEGHLKSGTCRSVLDSICNHDVKWFLERGVIVIQDLSFIENPDYPVKKYKFSCSFDADTPEKLNQQREQFFIGLWKYRIVLCGLEIQNNRFVPVKKDYAGSNLRDIVLDSLQNSNSLAVFYKIVPDEIEPIYKMLKEHYNYNEIMDAGTPLYGIDIKNCKARKEEKSSIKPLNENVLSKEKDVIDGNKLLEEELSWNYDRGFIFKIELTNVSTQDLIFKSIKTGNLIIHETASDDKYMKKNFRFLLYPPSESDISDDFILKPSEKKQIKFPFLHARLKKYKGPFIWDIGAESDEDLEICEAETIAKPKYKYGIYGVLVYFYDKDGHKYKSFKEDCVDIDRDNPKAGLKSSQISLPKDDI